MLNLTIFHGYAEGPNKVWIPWLHQKAEEMGWRVEAPQMPDSLRPNYRRWLSAAQKTARHWNKETLVVCHSLGGPLALRTLASRPNLRIRGLILVGSPFCSILSNQALIDFFDHTNQWERLRTQIDQVTVIQAKNDPLIPYDHALRYSELLDAKLILRPTGNHFIGHTAPEVLRAVKAMI